MPKKGHIPERTCIVCRKKLPKKELLRFCIKNNQIVLDKTQKGGGRGAYFCSECLSKIKNLKVKRKLFYALRIKNFNKIKDIVL
ncbi:MAG: DUF448 domain-containing protein [Thermodesulfobacteriota bacterium]|nr:MAG: DUF448 domain-containing protein [Thermodesulfobacteriota bacterium]